MNSKGVKIIGEKKMKRRLGEIIIMYYEDEIKEYARSS